MTDQELNEAVARKLHGEEWRMWSAEDYCHSIEAAWEIVEKLHAGGTEINLSWMSGIPWEFTIHKNFEDYEGEADTAPMAICRAFLKLES